MVAVSSLISRPPVFLEFFDVNLWDFLSSQIALWVTIFVSVEVGIATGVGFSLAVLLFRVARPQLQVLRPLRTRPDVFVVSADSSSLSSMDYRYRSIRDTASLPPGVLVFRMEESATFPNMETFKTWAQDQVYRHTRFGGVVRTAHDRLWSDNLELHIQRLRTHQHLQQQYALNEQQHRLSRMERRYNEGDEDTTTSLLHSKPSSPPLLPFSPSSSSSSSSPLPSDKDLPFLRAVILDCSAMNNIDTTGLQGIRDLNENLKDYAGVRDDPTRFFELHFTGVQETVLPILERSGLTLPTRPPPLPSFSSYSETVISPTTTTPLHQLHEAGHANEPQRDRSDQHQSRKSSSSSIDSLRSIGSVPSLDSLIHLTIRDAVDAVLSHASAWRRAIADNGGTIRGAAEGARSSTPTTVGESVINVDDYGESSSMISDPESDQDSTHKQPSTHELQYI
ncbi:hypothetical protein EDD11_010577 [Mortierella claussenii]|nr:hypothetical protein EDD11_010577 [Mortierella claussenii]